MRNYFKKFMIMFMMALAITLGGYTGVFATDIKYTDNLIPKMTADVTANGIASASSFNNGGYNAYKAFDKTFYKSDKYACWIASNGSLPQWISYQFPTSKKICKYTIANIYFNNTNEVPKDWTFQSSNDGINWTTLDTEVGISFSSGEKKEFTFTNDIPYTYYRIYITANNGCTSETTIDEIEMMEKVQSNIASISLNKIASNLKVNDIEQLIATITPSGIGVKWKSSDESVATVDQTGKVTAIKEGQATITITTTDGSDLSASCVVNVKPQQVITTSSAVSIGEQLTSPEDGWKRYDDNDSIISYNSDWTLKSSDTSYNGTRHLSNQNSTKQVQFGFNGTKLRIIGTEASNRSKAIKIEVDGKVSTFGMYKDTTSVYPQALCYEITGLSEGEHKVKIYDTTTAFVDIDAIDIDSSGKLISYNGNVNPQNNVVTVEVSKLQSEIDSIQELVTALQNKLNSMQNELNAAKTKVTS